MNDQNKIKAMENFSDRVLSKNPMIIAVVAVVLSVILSNGARLPLLISIALSFAIGLTVSALWYLIVNPFETKEELWFMFKRIVIGFSIVVFLFIILFVYYFKFLSI
ncbi:MAG: 4-amino-4-deoxy-L-arabinose transferase-like glycosyltransferase [Flammeovirgaceae bacterium]|jgi:4-amino-4-deoxy-L-arabinose transferase-like glycosyltransferase